MKASSISSSIGSSSSELDELSDAKAMWLLCPMEPETFIRSWLPITDQSEFDDCSVPYSPMLRPGIFIALPPPIVGEVSGEDCSASVEWCRLVAALEKSKPRDRLGSMLVGEA